MDCMFHTTYNEETKTWHGLPRTPTYNPNVSVGQILLEALGRYPKKIGQVSIPYHLLLMLSVVINKII